MEDHLSVCGVDKCERADCKYVQKYIYNLKKVCSIDCYNSMSGEGLRIKIPEFEKEFSS